MERPGSLCCFRFRKVKVINLKQTKKKKNIKVTYFVISVRFEATDDDIRRAYRKMVLQHHPDKRKAKGEDVKTDDDYFTCITKAYETLGKAYFRMNDFIF